MDFTITAFGVPIVSSKVAAAIESQAGGDVQRVPAAIKGHFGFEALNVLRIVECIDESKSEFQKWTERDNRPDRLGHYRSVTKLRLDTTRISESDHIFRLAGWEVTLVVSEKLKQVIEQLGARADFQLVTDDGSERRRPGPPDAPGAWATLAKAVAGDDPFGDDTLTGVVGFTAGGPLSFRTAPAGNGFTTYLSCELVADPEQKRSPGGPYELMITCDDEDWVLEHISEVARLGHTLAFRGGQTLDMGAIVGSDSHVQGIAFEEAARVRVARKSYRVLRCHGILRAELEYAKKKSVDALLRKLKSAGVYPRTSPKRSRSVL
jgi:hypothetical protein